VLHIAFDQPARSRQARAASARSSSYFSKYEGIARSVLEALVDKYSDTGILNVENTRVLYLDPFTQLGSPIELLEAFGGRSNYEVALQDLEKLIYA